MNNTPWVCKESGRKYLTRLWVFARPASVVCFLITFHYRSRWLSVPCYALIFALSVVFLCAIVGDCRNAATAVRVSYFTGVHILVLVVRFLFVCLFVCLLVCLFLLFCVPTSKFYQISYSPFDHRIFRR